MRGGGGGRVAGHGCTAGWLLLGCLLKQCVISLTVAGACGTKLPIWHRLISTASGRGRPLWGPLCCGTLCGVWCLRLTRARRLWLAAVAFKASCAVVVYVTWLCGWWEFPAAGGGWVCRHPLSDCRCCFWRSVCCCVPVGCDVERQPHQDELHLYERWVSILHRCPPLMSVGTFWGVTHPHTHPHTHTHVPQSCPPVPSATSRARLWGVKYTGLPTAAVPAAMVTQGATQGQQRVTHGVNTRSKLLVVTLLPCMCSAIR
jgi:hypothetical protein